MEGLSPLFITQCEAHSKVGLQRLLALLQESLFNAVFKIYSKGRFMNAVTEQVFLLLFIWKGFIILVQLLSLSLGYKSSVVCGIALCLLRNNESSDFKSENPRVT